MVDERYLLELEDKIEDGVVELLTSDTGIQLATDLWRSLDVNPYLFVIKTREHVLPRHALIGQLPKNYPRYHKIQPDGDVDCLAITCEFNAEGHLIWPPVLRQLSAVEVKAAYGLVETKDGKPSLVLYGLTEKKLKKAVTQCEGLLLMGFDRVSMLVGIATEPQGGQGSQPWMNAFSISAEAFFKSEPVLKSLPIADFGIASWPIGAVGGPLPRVPRDRIPKGKHPLKIDPSATVAFRKTERFAGTGCAQLIRPALNNSQINQPNVRNLRKRLHSNLTNMLTKVPRPTALPAVLRWDRENKGLMPVLGFPVGP